jgi:hypothetical protein
MNGRDEIVDCFFEWLPKDPLEYNQEEMDKLWKEFEHIYAEDMYQRWEDMNEDIQER